MPDTDNGALLVDGGVIGIDDVAATLYPHGAAHDGAVGAECDGPQPVDGAGGGEHPGFVALVEQLDAVVVEEGAQTQQRVTRIDLLANGVGGHSHGGPSWSDGV